MLSNMSAEELERLAAVIEKFEGGRSGITCRIDDACAPENIAQIQQLLRNQRITEG